MKKTYLLLFALSISFFIFSCGNQDSTAKTSEEKPATGTASDPSSYDPKRGEGKFTADNIKITDKLDAPMATNGEKIAATKCTSCHKLNQEKLVGPGWSGVTTRRTPAWIMNFITNPDPMIDKDPEAKAMLEICLVRMPNQSLADNDVRALLEYMRKVDGVK